MTADGDDPTSTTSQPTAITATTDPAETRAPGEVASQGSLRLDPGDAYASPRNIIAAYLNARFEGDCGAMRALATADNDLLARGCDQNPDTFEGSSIDSIGEAIAIGQGFNVQANVTFGDGDTGVLVFETTDVDGNWLVPELLSYE